tara:strand:+ start:15869 stop:16405 length:537 start_codon:yes stop_codon:yes gene_type:complete
MSEKAKKPLYNQLLVIENTQENRETVKNLNKRMKDYGSRWRLSVRYRKPKKGHKYGYGGSLACENADGLGIYVKPCKEAQERENEAYSRVRSHYQSEVNKVQTKLNKIERINKLLIKHLNLDDEWDSDYCPLCQDNDIECVNRHDDWEEWFCNSCHLEWDCNVETKRDGISIKDVWQE